MRGTDVLAEVTLPVCELKLGWQKPFPINDADTVVRDYGDQLPCYVASHLKVSSLNGQPWTVTPESGPEAIHDPMQDVRLSFRLVPPKGAPVDQLRLHYDAITHQLVTHSTLVTVHRDWRNGVVEESSLPIGTLTDTQRELVVDRSNGSLFRGFSALFRLGVDHIREGTDHLLFLLALLLPAPLARRGKRWAEAVPVREATRKIIRVVSGFTIGHSVTLLLGAIGLVSANERAVESLIAISVLVSAIHAWRPILRGREVVVAAVFGLVHGLAFASTIQAMGFDVPTLLMSILGFNLGIEAFQLVVVAFAMPPLMMLARTRLYSGFRALGSVVAGVAATAWLMDRAFGIASPVMSWADRLSQFGGWILLVVFLVALLFRPRKVRLEPV